uniref:Uncharacterized protein n=1 Tax=Taeniopygia guttata TaxID=59729 RepID=A0A674G930_TAEGU
MHQQKHLCSLLSRPWALRQHLPLEWEDSQPQALGCQVSSHSRSQTIYTFSVVCCCILEMQLLFSILELTILIFFVNSLLVGFPVSSSSASASSFSFKTSSSLTSSTSCGSSLAADGRSAAAANPPAFGTTSSPSAPQSVGFGRPAAPSAASFSFKAAATAGGFGTSGFLGFGSASAGNSASTTPAAFGAFGATITASALPSSSALSGQGAGASGHPVTSASAAATNSSPASEKLFTPKSELSAEEWQQFEAKEFTIGKIPLKPPPLGLLNAFNLLSLF